MWTPFWGSWGPYDPPHGDYYAPRRPDVSYGWKSVTITFRAPPPDNYFFWLGKEAEAFHAGT